MTRYINIFTRKYRRYQEDFIRWCEYGSAEEARKGAVDECPSNCRFKKTIIIEVDDTRRYIDFSDTFFEKAFPETHHNYDGDVTYINLT